MNEWISVKDQVPKKGLIVLVYTRFDSCCFDRGSHICYRKGDKFFHVIYFEDEDPIDCLHVSHWMPLPEPPKVNE